MKTEDVLEGVGLRCSVLLMKEVRPSIRHGTLVSASYAVASCHAHTHITHARTHRATTTCCAFTRAATWRCFCPISNRCVAIS